MVLVIDNGVADRENAPIGTSENLRLNGYVTIENKSVTIEEKERGDRRRL